MPWAHTGETDMIRAHAPRPVDSTTIPPRRLRFKNAPSRVAGRRSPNLAGVIYGTILATAIVAGMDEQGSVSSARALGVLLATGAILWSARVYAYLFAERLRERRRVQPGEVRRLIAREWPVFQATLPLAVPLTLGTLGVLSTGLALVLATLVGVAMLIGWGVVLSRRAGQGRAGVVGAAAVNSLVGLLIISLELAIP
jgi:hypothetical protein